MQLLTYIVYWLGELREIHGEAMKLSCSASTSPQGILSCYVPGFTAVLSRWTVLWKLTDHRWYLLISVAVINMILMVQWQWLMWKEVKELLPRSKMIFYFFLNLRQLIWQRRLSWSNYDEHVTPWFQLIPIVNIFIFCSPL